MFFTGAGEGLAAEAKRCSPKVKPAGANCTFRCTELLVAPANYPFRHTELLVGGCQLHIPQHEKGSWHLLTVHSAWRSRELAPAGGCFLDAIVDGADKLLLIADRGITDCLFAIRVCYQLQDEQKRVGIMTKVIIQVSKPSP